MKKSILVVLAIGLVLSLGTIAMAGTAPGSGIGGTFHDLSSNGAGGGILGETADHNGLNRICIYCHAPHNTVKPELTINTYRPLWNHAASGMAGYDMYTNGTDIPGDPSHQSYAATILQGTTMPGSVSLLCLSCHDGSTAINMYGALAQVGPGRGTGGNFIIAGGRALIGGLGASGSGDLSNHHPIGFNYDDTVNYPDNEINPSATVIVTGVNGPTSIAGLLWNGNVECTSCHDVHNTQNAGDKFTWIQDTGSALCLTCHKKNG